MLKYTLAFIGFQLVALSCFAQNFNVGEKTLSYTDSSRHRPVRVELWYPTNDSDASEKRKTDLPFILMPTIRDAQFVDRRSSLVIISHGSGGNRYSLAWLAISLAKQGYVVAAIDHWGGTYGNMIPAYYMRYWERPLDVSFLITKMLGDHAVDSFVNPDQISVVGYSFGGYTTLALAGADLNCNVLKQSAKTKDGKKELTIPEFGDLTKMIDTVSCPENVRSYKDNRIRKFVALAPGLGLGYSSAEQCRNVQAPVLIIAAGKNDQVTPLATNAQRYHNFIPSSRLIVLEALTAHSIFLNEADDELRKEAPKLFKDNKAVNRRKIHEYVAEQVKYFLNTSSDIAK